MYPLIQIGPFRLSAGGLALLLALFLTQWDFVRRARRYGGEPLAVQADHMFLVALVGAIIGGRLWYMAFNLDLLARTPSLLWSLQLSDWAWPGAFLSGAGAASIFGRWRSYNKVILADRATLALPLPLAIASAGLLLSGEAFGAPTMLPWAVSLFGAERHPTQLYYALAAFISFVILRRLECREARVGVLAACGLFLHGVTMLLVEALRADSVVLHGGVRAAQIVGLALIVVALVWLRGMSQSGTILFSSSIAVDAHADGRA